MDAMASLLDGPRAREAFLLRIVMEPPWCIRVQDEAPLSIMAISDGEAWIFHDGDETRRPPTGRRGRRGRPDAVHVRVAPGPGAADDRPSGAAMPDALGRGSRRGDEPRGAHVGQQPRRQLDGAARDVRAAHRGRPALPRRPPAADREPRLRGVGLPGGVTAGDESPRRARPGGCARPPPRPARHRRAASVVRSRPTPRRGIAPTATRSVGRALQLLHHNPAHPWTVGELASQVGLSRAALARRFTELVGEPPMTYPHRLAPGARRRPAPRAGRRRSRAVADEVGYSSPFALSTAFKRHRGMSPQQYRAAV